MNRHFVGLGLREMHDSNFPFSEMRDKLRRFAAYGLTRLFRETTPDEAVEVTYQGRSFRPVVADLSAEKRLEMRADIERAFADNVLGDVSLEEIRKVSEGRQRSHLWVPGYSGGPKMLEFVLEPGAEPVRRRAQSLDTGWKALQDASPADFLRRVFETALRHQLIVIAS